MKATRSSLMVLGLAAFSATGLYAQNVVSAKAGLVHLVEGDVFLADKALAPKITEFPDIKDNQVLRTEIGRAEVLLAPGAILRMGEQSSFRLLSGKLADTRLEVLTGQVMIEVAEYLKENTLSVSVNGTDVTPKKAGIYSIEANPARVRVFEGEAVATNNTQSFNLKDSREIVADGSNWKAEKFDDDITDPLFRWSKRRSGYLAMANVSAAASRGSYSSYSSVYGGSGLGLGSGGRYSGWVFNPYLGMMTYLPYRDMIYSPFGYAYWTPYTVYQAYYGGYGNGYNNGSGGGSQGGGSVSRSPVFDNSLGYGVTNGRSYGGYSGSSAGGYSGGMSAPSGGGASAPASSGGVRGGGGAAPSAGAVGRGSSGGGGRGQ